MSEISIIKGTPEYSERIVELFKKNYRNLRYHYVEFNDIDKNMKFVEKNMCYLALHGDKVVGFAAACYTSFENAVCVKLAHLLVDEDYRSKGKYFQGYSIGEKLEDARKKFYDNLHKNINGKPLLVYASCVPGRSVELKKNIDFKMLGVRTNYGPKGENRVIMGKIYNCSQMKRHFETPTVKTQNFLKFISEKLKSDELQVEFIYKDPCNGTIQNKYQIAPSSVSFRISAEASGSGSDLDEIINTILQSGIQYKSFFIEPSCANFKAVDTKLNEKGFVPAVYLPFYNNGTDVIEYQHKVFCTSCIFTVL
ncbi:MAG: GNAT family N-acetyltransferase [Candidatus Bathyarchaeota archaeon]|nr:GNAT family N-acetyltransferase [Candidatus Termiticorpusculum sp.]